MTRVDFDAMNPDHLKSYESFVKNGTWADSEYLFRLEWPYYDVPTMIQNKIVEKHLPNLIKSTSINKKTRQLVTESIS